MRLNIQWRENPQESGNDHEAKKWQTKKNNKDGDVHEDETGDEKNKWVETQTTDNKRRRGASTAATEQQHEAKKQNRPTHRQRDTGQNEMQTKTDALELSLWQICPRRRIDPFPLSYKNFAVRTCISPQLYIQLLKN